MFVRGSDRYLLVNLSDSPRVLVNDRPVSGRVVLADGDRVEATGTGSGSRSPAREAIRQGRRRDEQVTPRLGGRRLRLGPRVATTGRGRHEET
ncbi:MAG: hypothetical protein M9894_01285 [Planctomycetes bacterium]|nr:hypothetical protein [Planctomycetota bacterium]